MDATVETGLFTLGGVLVGGGLTALLSLLRDQAADVRSLRDQRAARLTDAFIPVMRQAQVLATIVQDTKFGLGPEGDAKRQAQFEAVLRDLSDSVDIAVIVLRLESDTDLDAVLTGMTRIREAYVRYMALHMTRQDPEMPARDRPRITELIATEKEMLEKVDELRASMRTIMSVARRRVPFWLWKRR